MTKVFPNSTFHPTAAKQLGGGGGGTIASGSWNTPPSAGDRVLTVWKKSLLMNCNGFTVFDARGNLVYRVDNYVAGNRAEIVLMNASGKPLLTIRRKRLSFGDTWTVYDGEKTVDPRFSFRRHVNFRNSKTVAQVVAGKSVVYEIEGAYAQRSVAVYDNARRCVAEVRPKEAAGGVALGVDVFRLIVRPYMDTATSMAFVIVLDQIFGSSSYSAPKRRSA